MFKFRELRADEIEIRVGSVSKAGITLLLYQDARAAMNVLDETIGPMNWQNEYSRENRNCTISIWDDNKKQWISKEDTGTESYSEKEKGLASDSFKRAAVRWGIGRELYTAPFIFISVPTEYDGKRWQLTNRNDGFGYSVREIGYRDGKITTLVIAKNGTTVYEMRGVDEDAVRKLVSLAQNKGMTPEQVAAHYGVQSVTSLTGEQYRDAVMRLLA